MDTITVTIGRNTNGVPLPQEEWNDFASRTRAVIQEVTSELWAATPYKGQWENVPEEAMLFYGPIPDASPKLLANLRATLANLATYYGQDAIGLSVGTGELVESWPVATGQVAS